MPWSRCENFTSQQDTDEDVSPLMASVLLAFVYLLKILQRWVKSILEVYNDVHEDFIALPNASFMFFFPPPLFLNWPAHEIHADDKLRALNWVTHFQLPVSWLQPLSSQTLYKRHHYNGLNSATFFWIEKHTFDVQSIRLPKDQEIATMANDSSSMSQPIPDSNVCFFPMFVSF